MRNDGKVWLVASLLCIWPIAANADSADVEKLATECGVPDLPRASLDSCLERVRVLEETDPSPQLQTLEASLEQRESAAPTRTRAASESSPQVVEVAPDRSVSAEDESGPDQSISQTTRSDGSAPRSGAALEDEPPVADPPDAPAGTDRTTDDGANDPPQS
ncbi:MAG TPA: hypothetical protein VKR31_16220 [Rhizomicrobium sp.]|nr:hypothetical protein [Rhizomicrobium sp.]